MDEAGGAAGGPGAAGRPRRVDRSRGGERLRALLATGARALAVLAGLGVVGELMANLLRVGVAGGPVLALGAAAVVAAGAVLTAWRRPSAGRRGRARGGPPAPADDAPSRRTLRWRRRLGGQGPAAAGGAERRQARRRRHRRGRDGPTSSGG